MNARIFLWLSQQFGGKEILWMELPYDDRLYIDPTTGSMWTESNFPVATDVEQEALTLWEDWKLHDAAVML